MHLLSLESQEVFNTDELFELEFIGFGIIFFATFAIVKDIDDVGGDGDGDQIENDDGNEKDDFDGESEAIKMLCANRFWKNVIFLPSTSMSMTNACGLGIREK